MNAIIGKKILQTEIFLKNGVRIPVTKIDVSGNTVIDIKTEEKHGYSAIQLGYGVKKKGNKAILGHVKKANLKNAPILIREVRNSSEDGNFNIGDNVNVESVLQIGDIVTVTGTSKGKGFAGVVKRHNFRGGPRTHGQSDRERAPGSIGQTTTPGRVYKGKRMAGRMGHEKSSALNLLVVSIETRGGKSIVLVKGLVPGSVNSLVAIKKTGKLSEKKFVPVLQDEVLETKVTEDKTEDTQAAVENANEAEGITVEAKEDKSPDVKAMEDKSSFTEVTEDK